MTQTYLKTENDITQNLIDYFFLWLSEDLSIERILIEKKKYGFTGLISEKPEALYAKLNKRPEAATKTYSTTGDFLQYLYSVLVAKNYQKIRSKCLVHEFFFRC